MEGMWCDARRRVLGIVGEGFLLLMRVLRSRGGFSPGLSKVVGGGGGRTAVCIQALAAVFGVLATQKEGGGLFDSKCGKGNCCYSGALWWQALLLFEALDDKIVGLLW